MKVIVGYAPAVKQPTVLAVCIRIVKAADFGYFRQVTGTFPLLNIYDFNTVPVITTGSEIKRIEEEAEAAVETSEVSKQTGLHN